MIDFLNTWPGIICFLVLAYGVLGVGFMWDDIDRWWQQRQIDNAGAKAVNTNVSDTAPIIWPPMPPPGTQERPRPREKRPMVCVKVVIKPQIPGRWICTEGEW